MPTGQATVGKMNPEQLKEFQKKLSTFRKDPTFKRTRSATPLGKLFNNIEKFTSVSSSNENTLNELYNSLHNVQPETLKTDDLIEKRKLVIKKLLEYLKEIHQLTLKKNQPEKSFIAIPLYDIKLVGKLVNLIVIEGVYTCLPTGIGIPLDKRRWKSFEVPLAITAISNDKEQCKSILLDVIDTFIIILNHDKENESDLQKLVLVGSGYTDALTSSIYLYIISSQDNNESQNMLNKFQKLELQAESTYELLSIYTLLINNRTSTSGISIKFYSFVMDRLNKVPIERKNGIQALIDLVMGLRDDEDVNWNKLQNLLVLLMKMRTTCGLTNIEFFKNLFKQFYELLIFVNRPIMGSIVSALTVNFFELNKLVVADFLFKKVWFIFNPSLRTEVEPDDSKIILSSEIELNNAFNVLISLCRRTNSLEFLSTLLQPILVPLWGYLIYQKNKGKDHVIIENLLLSYLSLDDDNYGLKILFDNVCVTGGDSWEFSEGENELTLIKSKVDKKNNESLDQVINNIDSILGSFAAILKSLDDNNDGKIQFVFIHTLKRWFKLDNSGLLNDDDPLITLIDLKLLEKIVDKFKDRLGKSVDDLLDVIKSFMLQNNNSSNTTILLNVTKDEQDSDDEDEDEQSTETQQVVFDLLSVILNETSLTKTSILKLNEIKSITKKKELRNKIDLLLSNENKPITQEDEQRKENDKLMERALKNISDPLPPIKVYGLDILRGLVKSNYVDINRCVSIHLSFLNDQEPFLYLNAIKGLKELLEAGSSADLLERYLKIYQSKTRKLDERLRMGEVLLRYTNDHEELPIKTSELIMDNCILLIRKDNSNLTTKIDEKLRLSAISLLGITSKHSNYDYLKNNKIDELYDIINGVLNLETTREQGPIRRSILVLINDLVTIQKGDGGLQLLGSERGTKLEILLKYINTNDTDVLVRQDANNLLFLIDELFEEKLKLN